jgi:hypothetical protein
MPCAQTLKVSQRRFGRRFPVDQPDRGFSRGRTPAETCAATSGLPAEAPFRRPPPSARSSGPSGLIAHMISKSGPTRLKNRRLQMPCGGLALAERRRGDR